MSTAIAPHYCIREQPPCIREHPADFCKPVDMAVSVDMAEFYKQAAYHLLSVRDNLQAYVKAIRYFERARNL